MGRGGVKVTESPELQDEDVQVCYGGDRNPLGNFKERRDTLGLRSGKNPPGKAGLQRGRAVCTEKAGALGDSCRSLGGEGCVLESTAYWRSTSSSPITTVNPMILNFVDVK